MDSYLKAAFNNVPSGQSGSALKEWLANELQEGDKNACKVNVRAIYSATVGNGGVVGLRRPGGQALC
jgi:hypothetical protein